MNTSSQQAEFERLQRDLESRLSITHFAHAGVSMVVALIVASAAAKLFWDSAKIPYLGILASVISLTDCGYGVVRYLRGRKVLRTEVEQFERMKNLRSSLGLDDPASLLPNR